MVIEICEHGIGIGGMGLMRVDPWRFIFEIPREKLEEWTFLSLVPPFSIGGLQRTNDLTNFRWCP